MTACQKELCGAAKDRLVPLVGAVKPFRLRLRVFLACMLNALDVHACDPQKKDL